jgi:ppGpp synthetase/RelA/SpoT-type nucleotidyltranferase
MVEAEKFKNIRIELQIRTVIQDAWSILDHKIKYKNSIPQNLKRRINRLSALFEIADEEFLNIQKEKKQSLNPYTKIRYCLFRLNEKDFNAILSLHQQGIFTSQI